MPEVFRFAQSELVETTASHHFTLVNSDVLAEVRGAVG